MQLTEWFDYTTKPVREGVYETRNLTDGNPRLQHWNGKFWGPARQTVDDADRDKYAKAVFQLVDWRGLAQDPSA